MTINEHTNPEDTLIKAYETRGSKYRIEIWHRVVNNLYDYREFTSGSLVGCGGPYTLSDVMTRVNQTIRYAAGTGPGSQNYKEVKI